MAANLAKKFKVRSYDLNGSGNCRSAREAAEGSDALITMVPDGKRRARCGARRPARPQARRRGDRHELGGSGRHLGFGKGTQSQPNRDGRCPGVRRALQGERRHARHHGRRRQGGGEEGDARAADDGHGDLLLRAPGRRSRREVAEQLSRRGGNARGIRGAPDRAALRPGSAADDRRDQRLHRPQQHHGAQDPAGHPDRRLRVGLQAVTDDERRRHRGRAGPRAG